MFIKSFSNMEKIKTEHFFWIKSEITDAIMLTYIWAVI